MYFVELLAGGRLVRRGKKLRGAGHVWLAIFRILLCEWEIDIHDSKFHTTRIYRIAVLDAILARMKSIPALKWGGEWLRPIQYSQDVVLLNSSMPGRLVFVLCPWFGESTAFNCMHLTIWNLYICTCERGTNVGSGSASVVKMRLRSRFVTIMYSAGWGCHVTGWQIRYTGDLDPRFHVNLI